MTIMMTVPGLKNAFKYCEYSNVYMYWFSNAMTKYKDFAHEWWEKKRKSKNEQNNQKQISGVCLKMFTLSLSLTHTVLLCHTSGLHSNVFVIICPESQEHCNRREKAVCWLSVVGTAQLTETHGAPTH